MIYLGLENILNLEMGGVITLILAGSISMMVRMGLLGFGRKIGDGCGVNMIFGRLMEQVTFIITQIQIGSFGILPIR